MGLHRAGFDVVGVDIKPQPRYPFEFQQGDALNADLGGYDFVWVSPPCQAHSALKTMPNARQHEDLIPATRAKLQSWGGSWVIENVPGAPLICPILLCGTMFGLRTGKAVLLRHRLFELSSGWIMPPCCNHNGEKVIGVYGGSGGSSNRDGTQQFSTKERAEAMGIDWMTCAELSQAIPPAYSEYLGRYVMQRLSR